MTPTYEELIRALFPRLTGGIRWGLERTVAMLAAVGDPHLRYRTIHVGGTNGKGSVAATMACALREAGHRTGLYSSPHLTTFRERIRIDGRPISEAALVAAAARLWPHIEAASPSFFEATTAVCFLALADAGVDVAVIEVGLGGRLDATNVITPELCVLTNVSLDHVQLLGDTVPEVAREKAGIIKQGVPVIAGETADDVLDVFTERARTVAAPLTVLPVDAAENVRIARDGTRFTQHTDAWGTLDVRTPLIGAHQARNVALAVAALERLPEGLRPDAHAVLQGAAHVDWPGRLQVVEHAGVTWVFDVAHNTAGVHTLVDSLARLELPRPIVMLVGVLGDKDWRSMLGPLQASADALVLTLPPTAPADRRWDPDAVLAAVGATHARAVPDFMAALGEARRAAGDGTVVVTGSFHTVGDALTALDLAPWGVDVTLPRASFAV